MTRCMLPALAMLFCACNDGGGAPPAPSTNDTPEVLFLVHDEVFAIRTDGTGRRSLGHVGDDRHRTGYPRFLPDGRVAVLADDTGGIFPFVGSHQGNDFFRIGLMNVTLNDALSGVTVGGQPRLVFTTSPFADQFVVSTRLYRMDVDHPALESVGFQGSGPGILPGSLSEPAPYDDSHVLAVRSLRPDGSTPGTSSVEILRVDRVNDYDLATTSEKLYTLPDGYLARSPARMKDGRVVFIRVDPANVSDSAIGELFVIGLDGVVQTTGATGVLAVEAVGDRLVYEEGGADGVSDLILTDLDHPPVNLTRTPFISEHLDWSD